MDNGNDVPWLSTAQRRPPEVPSSICLPPLLVDARGTPVDTVEAWQRRRAEIKDRWLSYLGRISAARTTEFATIEEDRDAGCHRRLIRYEAEPDQPVEAYLLEPLQPRGPSVGVVALHATSPFTIREAAGLEGDGSLAFGLELARQGITTICPRCFIFEGDHDFANANVPGFEANVCRFRERRPRATGMMKMLWDAMRAVDVLAARPGVDATRLGCVGHSLGGKEAFFLAAFDDRVKATAASECCIDIRSCNWDAPWYLGKEILGEEFGLSHHELLALVAPRAFLLVAGDVSDGPQSRPCIEAVLPVYKLYGGVPAVGLYNHHAGHTVPPEAMAHITQWFDAYL
ncbi:alpha/beta hydrolase family protein [Verrucomicrobiota bacterium]